MTEYQMSDIARMLASDSAEAQLRGKYLFMLYLYKEAHEGHKPGDSHKDTTLGIMTAIDAMRIAQCFKIKLSQIDDHVDDYEVLLANDARFWGFVKVGYKHPDRGDFEYGHTTFLNDLTDDALLRRVVDKNLFEAVIVNEPSLKTLGIIDWYAGIRSQVGQDATDYVTSPMLSPNSSPFDKTYVNADGTAAARVMFMMESSVAMNTMMSYLSQERLVS